MAAPTYRCVICGEVCIGHGNNPWPVSEVGQCCMACDWKVVIPARIKLDKEAEERGE